MRCQGVGQFDRRVWLARERKPSAVMQILGRRRRTSSDKIWSTISSGTLPDASLRKMERKILQKRGTKPAIGRSLRARVGDPVQLTLGGQGV